MIKNHQNTFSIGSFLRKLKLNNKSVTTYIGSFLLMAAVFGSLNIMRTNSTDLLKFIQFMAFFGMGCLNTNLLQSETGSFLSGKYFLEFLAFTLLISIFICAFLSAVYSITGSDILVAFGSTFSFLFPFLMSQAWFFYKHIPKNAEWLWVDSEIMPDELALAFRNKVPVRFQLSRKYFDMKEIQFPVTVSSWVKLGTLFHEFLREQEKNEASGIELVDDDEFQYGWEFYAESMGGFVSRQLNPKLNVRENKIIQNSIIVARRVKLMSDVEEESLQPLHIA